MELVRYDGTEEWSALYIDGKLDIVGDHYLIDERISELAGVTTRNSDSFMRDGEDRSSVAKTLEEIQEFEQEQSGREEAIQYREALMRKLQGEIDTLKCQ